MNNRWLPASFAFVSFIAACNTSIVERDGVDNPDGEPQGETCVAAEVGLDFGFSVNAAAWVVDGEDDFSGVPATQRVSATCTVSSSTPNGLEAEISLSCSEETLIDEEISIQLTDLPADFDVPLVAGADVQLDYYWQSDGHHISSGKWLVVHDASGTQLLLSAIAYSGVTTVGEEMSPLSLDVDDTICAAPCSDDYSCSDPHRVAVSVASLGGERVVVADGTRAELEAGDHAYDIVVSEAHRYTCLNCSSRYAVLIGAR